MKIPMGASIGLKNFFMNLLMESENMPDPRTCDIPTSAPAYILSTFEENVKTLTKLKYDTIQNFMKENIIAMKSNP